LLCDFIQWSLFENEYKEFVEYEILNTFNNLKQKEFMNF